MNSKIVLGAVPYLNAHPLLYGLSEEIRKETPSQLWSSFQKGEFDAALLSSYNALHLEKSAIVDGVAIGSRGAVYSVILAYEGELKNVKQILLDPASHTANHLLQLILKEFYGFTPTYITSQADSSLTLPRLLIGDPAIAFRQHTACSFLEPVARVSEASKEQGTRARRPAVKEIFEDMNVGATQSLTASADGNYRFLDLGEEWFRFTQLPFVFATWCLKQQSANHASIVKRLQQAKQQGLLHLKELALQQPDPNFTWHYWTQYISYDLGEEEWKGLKLFGQLLKQHHLMRIT